MARTQDERKAETRARLLAAAADLFARKGFHAVSAEAVADAAGRTTGALYSHFGGKEGLLLALAEQRRQAIGDRILERVGRARELDARLRALWTHSADRDASDGDAWALLEIELLLQAARDPVVAASMADRYASTRHDLGAVLAQWTEADGHHLDRPDQSAGLVIALLLGLALQRQIDPGAVRTTDIVRGLRALVTEH